MHTLMLNEQNSMAGTIEYLNVSCVYYGCGSMGCSTRRMDDVLTQDMPFDTRV